MEDGFITTRRVQEGFEKVQNKRNKDRSRKIELSTRKTEFSERIPLENGKIAANRGGKLTEERRGEEIRGERGEEEAAPLLSKEPKPRGSPEDTISKILALVEPYHDRAKSFIDENRSSLLEFAERDGLDVLLGALHVCLTQRVDKLRFFVQDYTGYRRKYLQEKIESDKDFENTQRKLEQLQSAEDEAHEQYDPEASLVAEFRKSIGDRDPPAPPDDDFEDDIPWQTELEEAVE